MNSFDRVLFLIFALAVALVSGYVLAAGVGILGPLLTWTSLVFVSHQLETGLVALGLLLLSLRFIYLSVVPRHDNQRLGFVQPGELGSIKVSLEAIEQLVLQASHSQRGIKQVKARLQLVPGGVLVALRATATPNHNLIELAAVLQSVVKEQVEKTTNIDVKEVSVTFAEVSTTAPRVF